MQTLSVLRSTMMTDNIKIQQVTINHKQPSVTDARLSRPLRQYPICLWWLR